MPKSSKVYFIDIFLSQGPWTLKCVKIVDFILGAAISFFLPEKEFISLPSKTFKKVLIIRPGGIGDAVFLLPILKLLKSQGIVVEILCESRNQEVFSSQGYKVYLSDRLPSWQHIFNNYYDVIVDTEQWHYFSAITAYFLKARIKVGFATRKLRKKLFNQSIAYKEDEHELNNFMMLFKDLLPEKVVPDINISFAIPSEFIVWASSQIPAASVSVFLGASIYLRRFSKNQLLEIIKDILSKGSHAVLIGGVDVMDVANSVVKELKNSRVLNFVGHCSLIESAALIQRTKKFIGPDSGLMHLACAVGTPVVTVFGPGHLQKWAPQGKVHQIITANAPCSPCTKFGYFIPTCHGSFHCMRKIKLPLG